MKKILISLFIIFVFGCSYATLKSYINPSLQPGLIKSVAIFSMRNVKLVPGIANELTRDITKAFKEKNPSLKIINTIEAINLLNEAKLSEKYSLFLIHYSASGIPDTKILNEIGEALKVNAIFQGELLDVQEVDGVFGWNSGKTSVTVRYSLLSTEDGSIIWEAISKGTKTTATTLESAPPLYEAISIAQKRILNALPKLGE